MNTFNEPEISVADTSDIPKLEKLVNSAYRGDSSRAGWTTEADFLDGIRIDAAGLEELILTPGSAILKYTVGTELLACVHLLEEKNELYLGMLTVSPALQGQGIGKKLLKAAEDLAGAKGLNAIVMTVITLRNELIQWYQRQGYARTGEIRPFPSDPRFGIPKTPLEFEVLRKHLKPSDGIKI